ncbi:MAG: GldM family protein, partial [Bacteroidota bacterium]
DPRQLMINLMYLVLTALLALNVSAEVMNAFKTIDDSLQKSNATTNKAVNEQQAALDKLLSDESKAKYKPLSGAVADIRQEISDFSDYVDNLKNELIDQAGNKNGEVDDGDYLYPENEAKKIIKGKKNKDVTTKMLVIDGKGGELETKIAEVRKNIVDIYTKVVEENADAFDIKTGGRVDQEKVKANIASFAENISLDIDQDWEAKSDGDKKSWADFRFRQMPLISVLPLLTKFQTDAKNAEALAVGKLAELAGGKTIEFNQFFPVINAKKAYVIKGDKFEAQVSLGAYSSDIPPENINLTVNGRRLPVGKDGKADFSNLTSSLGTQTLNLSATVKNPLTGEVTTETSTFEYEVGETSATVSADKMNVFYIGVDNPISVSVAGVSSNDVNVRCDGPGCNLTGSRGKYSVKVSRPGDVSIKVSGGGLSKTAPFRVKRIPDPVAKLGKKADGAMGNGEFKAQRGVIPWLDGFDFDAKCQIQGFNLVKVAKRQDPVSNTNRGGTFDEKSLRLVRSAKPGDTYYFENVKAKCPGDAAGRKINSMVFKIR